MHDPGNWLSKEEVCQLVQKAVDSGVYRELLVLQLRHGEEVDCLALQFDISGIRLRTLHYACYKGKLGIVKRIVENNPEELMIPDNRGFLPLHRAVMGNMPFVVAYLIGKKADVNATNMFNVSPLHISLTSANMIDCFKLLINCGADVFIENADGNTALHLSVMKGNLEAVKVIKSRLSLLLAEDGSNLFKNLLRVRNKNKKTAAELAASGSMKAMGLLLTEPEDVMPAMAEAMIDPGAGVQPNVNVEDASPAKRLKMQKK